MHFTDILAAITSRLSADISNFFWISSQLQCKPHVDLYHGFWPPLEPPNRPLYHCATYSASSVCFVLQLSTPCPTFFASLDSDHTFATGLEVPLVPSFVTISPHSSLNPAGTQLRTDYRLCSCKVPLCPGAYRTDYPPLHRARRSYRAISTYLFCFKWPRYEQNYQLRHLEYDIRGYQRSLQ